MVGWGLLNDDWQPAWTIGVAFSKLILYPRLYPRFAFDTPLFLAFREVKPATGPVTEKNIGCRRQATTLTSPPDQPGLLDGHLLVLN